MADDPQLDPELAELRARRLRELVARSREPVSHSQGSTAPTALDSASFGGFLAAHPRSVVDVWAPWCAPCRAMAPVLEGLAREMAPTVAFAKLNADDEPALAARFGVSGIPTLLLFERSRLVDRVVGALPREPLLGRISAVFRLAGPGAAPPGAA